MQHDSAKIEADFKRSSDTHLFKVDLPASGDISLYLKDESTHPTGSLKHRLARSLFLYALCNGKIGPETTVIEASSGSTAVSEAYFARKSAGKRQAEIETMKAHEMSAIKQVQAVCETRYRPFSTAAAMKKRIS